MAYNFYDNMSTKQKERLIEGSELQHEVMEYCNGKQNTDQVRTPKRQRSGEQENVNKDESVIVSGDDDNDFQLVSNQRRKIQRGRYDYNEHKRKNDVHTPDETNHVQQQHTKNRRITNASRIFVNGEIAAMNHQRKREFERKDIERNKVNHREDRTDDNQNDLNHLKPPDFDNVQSLKSSKPFISNHALHYAVEQHL